jgi:hypothetical protein
MEFAQGEYTSDAINAELSGIKNPLRSILDGLSMISNRIIPNFKMKLEVKLHNAEKD